MRRVFLALVVLSLIGGTASADPTDLSNGVLICHAAASPSFNPCGDWATLGISDCESQVNNITAMTTWYIVAAWTEDKEFCGVGFGFGDFDAEIVNFMSSGPCPAAAVGTATSGFPGPNEGAAYAVGPDIAWSGNFIPVYYFTCSPVGDGVMALDVDPRTEAADVGTCDPVVKYDFALLGAMGVGTAAGTAVCPPTGTTARACCSAGGVCQLLEEAECDAQGGDWLSGEETCDPNPCPVIWACCVDEICFMYTQDECTGAGGVWYVEENCDTFTCPELIRVCCVGAECSLTTEAECLALTGSWHGDLETCDPNPCATPIEETSWGTIKSIYR